MNMHANLGKLNTLFASFDQRVRPVTKRIRTMLIAKKLRLTPSPPQELIDKEMEEFTNRILPMLNDQLQDKLYFCGQVITGYDLQVFCELNSIRTFAQELVEDVMKEHANLVAWNKRIDMIPEVREKEQEFRIQAKQMLQDGVQP